MSLFPFLFPLPIRKQLANSEFTGLNSYKHAYNIHPFGEMSNENSDLSRAIARLAGDRS
jgi:hypothetical protein